MAGGHFVPALLALLPATNVVAPEDLRQQVEQAPKDVAAFIERRASCNHFLGESPYDEERATFLAKARRDLRCARVSEDEGKLRRAYRDRPEVLRLLDETVDVLTW
jgi:hypothetical protein